MLEIGAIVVIGVLIALALASAALIYARRSNPQAQPVYSNAAKPSQSGSFSFVNSLKSLFSSFFSNSGEPREETIRKAEVRKLKRKDEKNKLNENKLIVPIISKDKSKESERENENNLQKLMRGEIKIKDDREISNFFRGEVEPLAPGAIRIPNNSRNRASEAESVSSVTTVMSFFRNAEALEKGVAYSSQVSFSGGSSGSSYLSKPSSNISSSLLSKSPGF